MEGGDQRGMIIPLAQLVKAKRPRLRRLVLRPIEPTASQAADLAAIYFRTVRIWESNRARIVEAYSRANAATNDGMVRDDVSWLEAVLQAIVGEVDVELSGFQGLFTGWANQMVQWHTRRIVQNLKYAGNVDLASELFSHAGNTVADALARNASLVRNVSDETRAKIADIVFRGVQGRIPAREVAKEIAAATGIARKRALRIASDQAVKLSAALDRQRMRDLGFTSFEWRHSGKLHYRDWHKARNGKVFSLDDPKLRGDMPGDLPFCGCKSQATMELPE